MDGHSHRTKAGTKVPSCQLLVLCAPRYPIELATLAEGVPGGLGPSVSRNHTLYNCVTRTQDGWSAGLAHLSTGGEKMGA